MGIELLALLEVIWDILTQLDGISNLGLLILAGLGLNSWYKEYKYKKRSELAEEILCMFYQMQDVISWVRCPLALHYEMTEIKNQLGPASDCDANEKYAYLVPKLRIQEKRDFISSFYALKYPAKVKLNKELAPCFDIVKKYINSISINSSHLFSSNKGLSLKSREKMEAIIWEGVGEPDTIVQDVSKIVKNVECICEKYI